MVKDIVADWLPAHASLITELLDAAAHYKQAGEIAKLEAFAKVAAAFNNYARATNTPSDVCFMLSDLIGEFANRAEGRPPRIPERQKMKSDPRTTVQREALLAYAAVYVDYHGGTDEACRKAERKLRSTGGEGTGIKTGIKNWRKQRRSKRQSKSIDQHFENARNLVDKLASNSQISPQKAAEQILDIAVKSFG